MKAGVDLTEGPILKKMLMFAIPVLFTNLLQQLYNTADSIIVGNFGGTDALAAVGSTAALTNLIVNLFVGFAVGSNVVCARCYGAKDLKGLSKTVHTSFLLAMILGIPMAVIGWVASESFLSLMGTPDDVIGKAALYMKIYFLGAPAALVFNYGAAMLRAVGDTKRPLYILAASGIINVLLNMLCVIVFKMDVVGVALGTIVSQYVSAVAVLVIFMKTDSELKLKIRELRIYADELKQIVVVGIPSGINACMFSLSNVVLQSAVNSFGKTVMAANSVACNYSNFAYIMVNAGEQACISFVSQNMGAKKYKRIGKIVITAMMITCAVEAVYSVIICLGGDFFLRLFTRDAAVIDKAWSYLYVVIAPYVLIIPGMIYGSALRGMGKAIQQTVISLVFICFSRVLWVEYILPLNNVYEMTFVSYPVSWVLSDVAMAIVFYSTKYKLIKQKD